MFFTETKCKIRFIYVGVNCERKKRGKKCLEIMTIRRGEGGVRRLMEKTILNFHLDYLTPSLSDCFFLSKACFWACVYVSSLVKGEQRNVVFA